MVRGVRDAVGDALRLRIDPNQGYSPEVALELAKDLEPYALEFLEQPVPRDEIAAAAKIRRETATPIALNESVTTLDTVLEIVRREAADVLLPDTYQCGGILSAAQAGGLALMAAGMSPNIGDGLIPINPVALARLFLPGWAASEQTGLARESA